MKNNQKILLLVVIIITFSIYIISRGYANQNDVVVKTSTPTPTTTPTPSPTVTPSETPTPTVDKSIYIGETDDVLGLFYMGMSSDEVYNIISDTTLNFSFIVSQTDEYDEKNLITLSAVNKDVTNKYSYNINNNLNLYFDTNKKLVEIGVTNNIGTEEDILAYYETNKDNKFFNGELNTEKGLNLLSTIDDMNTMYGEYQALIKNDNQNIYIYVINNELYLQIIENTAIKDKVFSIIYTNNAPEVYAQYLSENEPQSSYLQDKTYKYIFDKKTQTGENSLDVATAEDYYYSLSILFYSNPIDFVKQLTFYDKSVRDDIIFNTVYSLLLNEQSGIIEEGSTDKLINSLPTFEDDEIYRDIVDVFKTTLTDTRLQF